MNNGKCISRVLVMAGAMLIIGLHTALAIPKRPEPARLVNDLAGLFSSEQTRHLEDMLVAFDDSTTNQIAVVTVTDLEGYDAAEYATRIGLDWGVGSDKFDNGIVVLVKPKTTSSGQVFIAVGYGLEGAIPDAYAKRIINNEMIPHFMQNDYFGGVHEACGLLMKLASGEISELRENDEDEDLLMIAFTMLMIGLIVLAVVISMKNGGGNGGSGGRNVYRGPVITIGNDFGGWGSSGSHGGFGGGFSGGFGGFGGGSFGGGGAGGSW